MKILIIGGNGTIGKTVSAHFNTTDEVIVAGRTAEHQVDIADSSSIQRLLETLGMLDAIICIAGEAKWAPFSELTEADYHIGLNSKLMGQVNLVRIGQHHLNPGGSLTLTTGILADDPVILTSSAAMVNGAVHSFVQAAALELPDGLRLNVVSSGVVVDAYDKYKDYFPGHTPIPMDKVIRGYERSVKGKGHGQVIRIYE
ncbi:MAG: short chain dehydrogenase [Flavobacteriaceae bacterium]|nr:short chain dehydrogenase [Flavobacteriaceae bacterium]